MSVVYLYHKQPKVLDSARKYCELISQKQYYTCRDKNDIITGGIAYVSICTDGYPNAIHPTEPINLFGIYWKYYFPRGIFEVEYSLLKLVYCGDLLKTGTVYDETLKLTWRLMATFHQEDSSPNSLPPNVTRSKKNAAELTVVSSHVKNNEYLVATSLRARLS